MADLSPSIFEQLRNQNDSAEWSKKEAEALQQERRRQDEAEQRQIDLINANRTLPCTIGTTSVLGMRHTRAGFLRRVCAPLLSNGPDRPQTLGEIVNQTALTAAKLNKFDIFEYPVLMNITPAESTVPSTTPSDYDVTFEVKEQQRFLLGTGTEVGNADGSAYANLIYRNLFGGAETLALHAAMGVRTRSAYQAVFATPLFARPDLHLELGGAARATQHAWASHEEAARSGWAKLRWEGRAGARHELTAASAWRTVTGLGARASPTVRRDAGHSVKNSVAYACALDRRNDPALPHCGYYLRGAAELAGWGPLRGDVAFAKSEVEAQGALPVPVPGVRKSGVSFTAGLRAGLIYPLGAARDGGPVGTRVNDRFQLGGPTDVRGFRMCGLGPRDGADAVGGDVYLGGSANLLFPVPGVGRDRPLRWQLFLNSGRLLGLHDVERDQKEGGLVPSSVRSAVAELGNGLPSTAAGIGLVYAASNARFELNFTLPLVLRRGEDARKGLQFGIGISFL